MEKDNISKFKNYQSDESIKALYSNAFCKSSDGLSVSKLSGGMKNSVYLLQNGEERIVLKVAPKDESKMISADRNILWWEARMLDMMKTIEFPSPRLLYYDDSLKFCSSPYIFMSYIEGNNYLEYKEKISENDRKSIEYEIGKLSSRISTIKGKSFFLPSQPTKTFNNNFEFVSYLFNMLLNDARNVGLDLENGNYEKIYQILLMYETELNNISNLCLTHTDIWDGNILINNGHVTGVVDFSDLYYCDELLTFYFHTIDGVISPDFLAGYRKKTLTLDEIIRIEIYRMYVILKMIVDCKLKQYGRFDWMYDNLNSRINTLRKIKNRG